MILITVASLSCHSSLVSCTEIQLWNLFIHRVLWNTEWLLLKLHVTNSSQRLNESSPCCASQFMSNRTFFFLLVYQTVSVKFFPKMLLAEQNKLLKIGSQDLGNGTRQSLSDPRQSWLSHISTIRLFWNVGHLRPRRVERLLPSSLSKRTEASWKSYVAHTLREETFYLFFLQWEHFSVTYLATKNKLWPKFVCPHDIKKLSLLIIKAPSKPNKKYVKMSNTTIIS